MPSLVTIQKPGPVTIIFTSPPPLERDLRYKFQYIVLLLTNAVFGILFPHPCRVPVIPCGEFCIFIYHDILFAGIFYLILCIKMNDWLGNSQPIRKPKILEFTCIFLLLNLAAETQRISVSGWSLTLISR